MHTSFRQLAIRLSALAAIATTSVAAGALPAVAASQCDTSQVQVEFLGIGASNTVLVAGIDGYYTGSVLVHVFCGLDGTPVTQATVSMWTTVNGSAIYDPGTANWVDATSSTSPVKIAVPTGDQQIAIRTQDPNLTGWRARVGSDTVAVIGAFGQTVTDNGPFPDVNAGIWAQTPELDSLSLFGAGGFGLVGYILLRRRAGRGSR